MQQFIPKLFSFEESNRERLVFSDVTKIRLNPATQRVELSVQSYELHTANPVYSLDTDLTVTTWLTNPLALKAWAGFSVTPHSNRLATGTSLRFKLNDGTNDRYWDGATWSVAGAADWNTEGVVATNVASFPVTSQSVAVVCNLVTTDASVTPFVDGITMLMDCEIDYLRSLIADSILVSLGNSIQPIIDSAMTAPGGARVDLRDLETAYNVSGVVEVYDHTADPLHATDLLSSYDVTSKVIMLSAAVTRGSALWVRFTAAPETYFNWSSQDYTEVKKLPAILLESFEVTGNTITAMMQVDNIAAFTAAIRRDPFRLRLDFDVVLLAEKNRTLLAMLDKALEYSATTPQIPWLAVDESLDATMGTEGLFRPRPSLNDDHAIRFSMSVHNIHLWLEGLLTKPLVQRAVLTLTGEQQRGGPLWTGVKNDDPSPNG